MDKGLIFIISEIPEMVKAQEEDGIIAKNIYEVIKLVNHCFLVLKVDSLVNDYPNGIVQICYILSL